MNNLFSRASTRTWLALAFVLALIVVVILLASAGGGTDPKTVY